MLFNEDFLHYVWKFRLFDHKELCTTTGERIEVSAVGQHNTDAGPDFEQSRIRIGDTLWAGNVEIHIRASDWNKHNHGADNAYQTCILHVVYYDDQPVMMSDGRQLATIELQNRVAPELYSRYHDLINRQQQIIPCEAGIKKVDGLTLTNWLTRVLIIRLEHKSAAVLAALDRNLGDWEETFYQLLASSFGFKVNAFPFELLAKSLPQKILAKHKNNAMQVEALIFGQAGMLDDNFNDYYPKQLQAEYHFLRKKYNLIPIEKHLWKFLRLRPQNFPTIRLAQFAALILRSNHLFSKVIEIRDMKELRKLFMGLSINDYWINHYQFDRPGAASTKNLGKASVDGLLLNTLAVVLFSYGSRLKRQEFVDRSLHLLETLPVEQNHIITAFEILGVKANTAFESQALLELRNNYCNFKKCLECGIGNQILKLTDHATVSDIS